MPALAPAALAITVVLSALGAVVLCILVVLYGFTPAGEEPPGAAGRRLLLTRIGHAVAAVCFAATAILIAVILAQPPRRVVPPAATADARVPALGARLDAQESRLAETEARLNDLERSLRREAERPAQTAEPTPERLVKARPPAALPKAAVTASRPAASRRPPAPLAETPAPTAPVPSAVPAPLVAVEPKPVPDATSPPSHEMEGAALAPPRAHSVSPAPAAVAPPRRSPGEPQPPGSGPASPPRFGLLDRLRNDWNTIRRGIESAEDDARRALDDTRRNVRRFLGE